VIDRSTPFAYVPRLKDNGRWLCTRMASAALVRFAA
jgi:hypothetical protein